MDAARVVLKMNNLDEVSFFCVYFFLWNPFGNHICVVIDTDYGVVGREFSEKLVVVNLINSDTTVFPFVVDLGLLCKSLNKVLNMPLLVHQDIKCFL